MNGEVVWAVIAQIVKVAHQPLHSSIRVNWEFSSNCDKNISNQLFVQEFIVLGMYTFGIGVKILKQALFLKVTSTQGKLYNDQIHN